MSALFSGTETTLTALTDRMTLQLMERRGRAARVLQAWRDRPNRIISTLLVGNNLVNIAASVLSVKVAVWFFRGYGDNSQAYADAAAVIGTTVLLLVFAEVSPKTFAKHNALRIAVPAMMFVRLVEYPLFPFAWVLTKLGRVIVTLFGGKASREGPTVTEEDIEYMIELGARERVFEKDDRAELLEAALEFGDTVAKEIMIPRTEALAVDVGTGLSRALDLVISRGHSRVPVFDEQIDRIIGILYAKDLLKAITKGESGEETIEHLVRTPVFFVPESQKIADTLREMQRRRVHLAVVVDEFGGFSGIITIEDILEELVGEIRDEYDREEELVKQVEDDVFLANALISVRDLGEYLDMEFPDEGDYETLGGFVVANIGCVPEVGNIVTFNNLELEVVRADDRHVEQVRITRHPSLSSIPDSPEATS